MRRVRVRPKCPNPLFESWLESWKQDAKSRGTEMQYCFGKALEELRRFPLPLKSGKECMLLRYFGPKICAMLDKKLEEYKAGNIDYPASVRNAFALETGEEIPAANGQRMNKENAQNTSAVKRARKSEAEDRPAKKAKTPDAKEHRKGGRKAATRDTGPYFPAWRSGGYAILLTLYEKSLEPDYPGYMTKADLQADAQKYCDSSLRKPDPGTRYCGWSSMGTLIERGLVVKKSNPAKYTLTDAGLAVAIRLSEVDKNDCASESVSQCASSSSRSSEPSARARTSQEVENFIAIDEDLEILPPANFENLSKQKTVQTRVENRLQILDVNRRTDSQQSASSEDDRTVVFRPETFDVVLLVDDRETAGGKTRPKDDITLAELTRSMVKFEVRNLKIGDFTWIARCRETGEELILPYIVERKRMDDFGGSIKDGRYREQKFRLKKSGVQNVTYLIEHHGNNQFAGLPLTTLFQAATNTLIQDGFIVKYTKSHRESMFYLASLSVMLTKIYRGKTLVASKKDDLTPSGPDDNVIQLMVFKDFNKAAAKVKVFRAKEMFIRHLIQLKGMSVEKALAIVDFYPTPTALKKAFDDCGSGGENLLASLQFGASKRQLGPALSKTLHQFYTRKDF